MRKVIEMQLKIGQVDISRIEIDLRSRDEIPKLLLGLQGIYEDREVRKEVFGILEGIVPKGVDCKNGRPGMELWNILVLGALRLNCNWDYDKVLEIANNHKVVREFLGHTVFEYDQRYSLQRIKDNISLFSPEVLDRISEAVVRHGHNQMGKGDSLKGRCDSFVGKTNVHYPTDINLLLDAMRKVIELTARHCNAVGIAGWRQSEHNYKKIKKLFNKVRKLKRSNSKKEEKRAQQDLLIVSAHMAYIELCECYLKRVRETIRIVDGVNVDTVVGIIVIEKFMRDAEREIDQIRRRVARGETIDHDEKVFSIFEEHTEWICKGKAGVSQELGVRVCILEDQYGFILHHHVMEKQTDEKIAVEMVREAKRKFSNLNSCSFDKGFHSQENQKDLRELLDRVVLPKKGKLSAKDKEIEHAEEFVSARKKHAAVESGINALENHGLDRCPDHGIIGFKRYVALSILARNLQILGDKIQKKKLKRLKRLNKSQSQPYPLAA
ncbi:ISNCY family transposase [Deltaproteobacteria bacterium TL4]